MIVYTTPDQLAYDLKDKAEIAEINYLNTLMREECLSNRINMVLSWTAILILFLFISGGIAWKDYSVSLPVLGFYTLFYWFNYCCTKFIKHRVTQIYYDYKRELARKYMLSLANSEDLTPEQLKNLVEHFICPAIDMHLDFSNDQNQ